MAEVTLTRIEAERPGMLPPVCMQCGAPARSETPKNYSSFPACPPPPDLIGCLLFPLWLFARSQAKRMTVQTPLCDRHARGWFTWSWLASKTVTDHEITLTGVSQEFAQTLEQHRAERRSRTDAGGSRGANGGGAPRIQIRCRECQALNDEQARFCSQCGSPV